MQSHFSQCGLVALAPKMFHLVKYTLFDLHLFNCGGVIAIMKSPLHCSTIYKPDKDHLLTNSLFLQCILHDCPLV